MKQKAVFFDRDGVLNEAIIRDSRPYSPSDISELRIISSALDSLTRLKANDFIIIVITNQPEVARGGILRENVEVINNHLIASLPIDKIYSCYHDDEDGCSCRKPLPGLILKGALEFNIDLKKSYLIGDRWRDIGAAQAAGIMSIFINFHYDEIRPTNHFYEVVNLLEAVNIIIKD